MKFEVETKRESCRMTVRRVGGWGQCVRRCGWVRAMRTPVCWKPLFESDKAPLLAEPAKKSCKVRFFGEETSRSTTSEQAAQFFCQFVRTLESVLAEWCITRLSRSDSASRRYVLFKFCASCARACESPLLELSIANTAACYNHGTKFGTNQFVFFYKLSEKSNFFTFIKGTRFLEIHSPKSENCEVPQNAKPWKPNLSCVRRLGFGQAFRKTSLE